MKRVLLAIVSGILLVWTTGCCCDPCGGTCRSAPDTCRPCGIGCGALRERCRPCRGPQVEDPGPGGMVTYPYYTTRGPRDYFAQGPSTIGP